LPVIFESGTVEMPALERTAKSPAIPRSMRATWPTSEAWPTSDAWPMPTALAPAAAAGSDRTTAAGAASANAASAKNILLYSKFVTVIDCLEYSRNNGSTSHQ